MSTHDDRHVQEVWYLIGPDGDEITVELWVDDETVHVDGGDGESYSADRNDIVNRLLPKYQRVGYRTSSTHQVNGPMDWDDEDDDGMREVVRRIRARLDADGGKP